MLCTPWEISPIYKCNCVALWCTIVQLYCTMSLQLFHCICVIMQLHCTMEASRQLCCTMYVHCTIVLHYVYVWLCNCVALWYTIVQLYCTMYVKLLHYICVIVQLCCTMVCIVQLLYYVCVIMQLCCTMEASRQLGESCCRCKCPQSSATNSAMQTIAIE